MNIVPNTTFDIPTALRAELVIDFSTYSLSVTETREREGQRGELNLIAPHRTQLPLAFAFSFHCWPSALPWIWKMSSNSSAGVGWYVQQCGLCCCTLPIPPAGRRHRRRAIARKKGRVKTVVELGHGQNSKRILTYQLYILNTNCLSALLLSFTKGMSILHLTK